MLMSKVFLNVLLFAEDFFAIDPSSRLSIGTSNPDKIRDILGLTDFFDIDGEFNHTADRLLFLDEFHIKVLKRAFSSNLTFVSSFTFPKYEAFSHALHLESVFNPLIINQLIIFVDEFVESNQTALDDGDNFIEFLDRFDIDVAIRKEGLLNTISFSSHFTYFQFPPTTC